MACSKISTFLCACSWYTTTPHHPRAGRLEEISTPQRYTVGGKAGDDGFVTRSGLEEI
jgi:hypothetical protein